MCKATLLAREGSCSILYVLGKMKAVVLLLFSLASHYQRQPAQLQFHFDLLFLLPPIWRANLFPMGVILPMFFFIAFGSVSTSEFCAQNPSIHRFKFGKIRGLVLSDGPLYYDTSAFLVPEEKVKKSFTRLFRKSAPIALSQNAAVLDVPSLGRVLVDTGSRSTRISNVSVESGKLFENLEAAGISTRSIDRVLLTHGHPDHVSGLATIDGKRAFPNAIVYIGKTEHDFWTNPFQIPNSTMLSDQALRKFCVSHLGLFFSILVQFTWFLTVQSYVPPSEAFRFLLRRVLKQSKTICGKYCSSSR